MPSLIYVARLANSSERLVQGLQSAGLHIQSFAPGQITADECFLVMTSEAVLASLRPASAAATTGKVDGELGDVPPHATTNARPESQAAIWNRLKTAAAKESATIREQPSSAASKIDRRIENLVSEVGLPAGVSSQKSAQTSQPLPAAVAAPSAKAGNPNLSPPLSPSKKKSRSSPAHSAIWCGMASRFNERSRLIDGPPYKLFWQTVAIVASMLIFAAIRPSTTGVSTSDTTSTTLASTSKELRQRVSGMRSQKAEVAKAAEAQLRQSDYFVAKDFTNHFKTGAHNIATIQKSELKPNAQGNENEQGSASHTRVIVD